jgi:hypothetical protein
MHLSFSAPDDYAALNLTDLVFVPAGPGPLVECVNVSIVRDMVEEGDEVFLFSIDPDQTDPAVDVDAPSASPVAIIDEVTGTAVREVGGRGEGGLKEGEE